MTQTPASSANQRAQSPSLFKLITNVPEERLFQCPADALVIIGRQVEHVIQEEQCGAEVSIGILRFSLFRLHQSSITQMAPHCNRVIIYGEADVEPPQVPGVEFVAIPNGSPLSREWFLIVDSPGFWGALISKMIPDRSDPKMQRYLFQGTLTTDERTVNRANLLLNLMNQRPASEVPTRDIFANRARWARIGYSIITHAKAQRLGLATSLRELPDIGEMLVEHEGKPPAALLDAIIPAALDLFDQHGSAGVILYRHKNHQLHPVTWSMSSPPSILSDQGGSLGQAIQQQEAILTQISDDHLEATLLPEAQSITVIPLIVNQDVWGVLLVGEYEIDPYEGTLSTLATSIAALLEQILAVTVLEPSDEAAAATPSLSLPADTTASTPAAGMSAEPSFESGASPKHPSSGGMPETSFGGMPPSSGGMPEPSFGGMPPSSSGMPEPSFGGMPPSSGAKEPSFGGMPPSSGGMPEPSFGGMPPSSGGMPEPSFGGMPPSSGMPPSGGGMPPSGGMPEPSFGGMPPSQNMPSPGGMPEPSFGNTPPVPQKGGNMPPSPSFGGMPPSPSQGNFPSPGGGMPGMMPPGPGQGGFSPPMTPQQGQSGSSVESFGLPSWLEGKTPSSTPTEQTQQPYALTRRTESQEVNWGELQKNLVAALSSFDQRAADQIWSEVTSMATAEDVCLKLLLPVQVAIGEAWHRNEVSVAAEHFTSRFTEGRLLHLLNSSADNPSAPLAVVGCAQSEMHEIGAIMISLFMKWSGFRVVYLGQSVPNTSIPETVRQLRPKIMAFSAVTIEAAHSLTEVGHIIEKLEPPRPEFIFGGKIFDERPDMRRRIRGGRYLEGDIRQAMRELAAQYIGK